MNKLKFLFSFLITSLIVLQSCSIEKRHYTSGYHLQWKSSTRNVLSQKTETTLTKTSNANTDINSLTASSDKKNGIVLLNTDSTGCDTLIMKDGAEIKAKILEVTPTEIKYRFCNNINGPVYVVYRYNVSYIKYKNGTLDSFVNEHPALNTPPNKNKDISNLNNNNNWKNGNNSQNNFVENYYVGKLSTTSLVCGIVSFFISFFGIITAIVALTSGYKSLRLINNDPANLWMYRGRTMAGIILGWIFVGLIILGIIILIIIFSMI